MRYSKKIITTLFFGCLIAHSFAQVKDTLELKEVRIISYFSEQPLFQSPSSASVIGGQQLTSLSQQSLVPVINTTPGVRMEERSPGSYRLSIRGSLLRSPFGIRNIKIYVDDFPFTDANGNTYLNLIDINAIRRLEILRGPDGSLFGANSGGVVKINLRDHHIDSTHIRAGFESGSYGLFHEFIEWQQHTGRHQFCISEGWQRCDGYRQNSSLDRKYIQLTERWDYSAKAQIRLVFLYSNLFYQTPGGLTKKQWDENPEAARYPTSFLPGAIEQQAHIHNSTFYGGLTHELKLGSRSRYVASLFASHTDFENPFITNYEVREEKSMGIRTWFETGNLTPHKINWMLNLGVEGQQTNSIIGNYGNHLGIKDTLQVKDRLKANNAFAFERLSLDLFNRLTLDISFSYNYNQYSFAQLLPHAAPDSERIFIPQLMPRFAVCWQIINTIAWRASVSRGYSPPTLAEIRPSGNIVNLSLQPENGWNYETGLRLRNKTSRWWWDVSVFYYELANAIVRRESEAGTEYFINAGGTKQSGIESELTLLFIPQRTTGFFRKLLVRNSFTLNHFVFNNYIQAADYSNNLVTGVPAQTIATSLEIKIPMGFSLYTQYYYTTSFPLNDANTVYSAEYHLVQIKAGWEHRVRRGYIELGAGIDNLLNTKYSLGHDLNAAGERYYNPAPGINYFGSAIWHF